MNIDNEKNFQKTKYNKNVCKYHFAFVIVFNNSHGVKCVKFTPKLNSYQILNGKNIKIFI